MIGRDLEMAAALERDAAAWLARLRANDPADQGPFEDWYARDQAHADAYDRVLRSWQATRHIDALGTTRGRGRRRRLLYVALAIAAVILFGMIGLGVATRRPPSVPAQTVALETRTGEVRAIRLPDGSAATLDTDSAIEGRFSAAGRSMRLMRGRVRFEVAAASGRPFAVETAGGQVSVEEGRFDIAEDNGLTQVALWQGSAEVRMRRVPAVYRRLVAGDALAFGGPVPPHETRAVDTRWTTGMLSFADAPLTQVVAAANRYAATPIKLGTAAIGERRFTGTFRAKDTTGLARMLAAMFDLTASTDDAGRILLTPRGVR